MDTLFSNLDIDVIIDDTTFSILNIACEQFLNTIPKHSHGHNSYELHYVSEGFGILRADDVLYDLSPNMMYVTGPYIEHEQLPFPSAPLVEYSIFCKVDRQSSKSDFLNSFLKTKFWLGQDTQGIEALLKNLLSELKLQKMGYIYNVNACIQLLIVMATRNYKTPTDLIKKTGEYEIANLAHSRTFIADKAFLFEYKEITLEKLSNNLGLSQRQTARFLKETYQKSFLQKRTDARMSAAAVFLSNSRLTIFDIAEKTGYSSVEYFLRAFKKYYNTTPYKFREKLNNSTRD